MGRSLTKIKISDKFKKLIIKPNRIFMAFIIKLNALNIYQPSIGRRVKLKNAGIIKNRKINWKLNCKNKIKCLMDWYSRLA